MKSIRSYLVTLLVAMLTLVSFLAALQSYRSSIQRAEQMFDDDLQVLAASLLDLYQEATPTAPLPADSRPQPGLNAVQVFRDGVLIYHNHSAPQRRIVAVDGFAERNFLGQRWRTYQLSDHAGLEVIAAQPMHGRLDLAEEVVLASIYPVVLSLPLQALLIWLLVSRGLLPLRHLAKQLSEKKADDLSPLELMEVPTELQPVLNTSNQLFTRLETAFRRERRFAADVAHELRTPLSVLQVDLYNLEQRWRDAAQDPSDPALIALYEGVARMSQLIEQILLLNRTNPEHYQMQWQPCDLVAICRELIVELYPQLERKQQLIEFEGPDVAWVRGDAFALQVLLRNLIGNASKYTPAEGRIRVRVELLPYTARVSVDDSGPGIPESEWQAVFGRFYRVGGDRHASGQIGSGLGLAIAHDIAILHQGQLTLSHSEWHGLSVQLELPCANC